MSFSFAFILRSLTLKLGNKVTSSTTKAQIQGRSTISGPKLDLDLNLKHKVGEVRKNVIYFVKTNAFLKQRKSSSVWPRPANFLLTSETLFPAVRLHQPRYYNFFRKANGPSQLFSRRFLATAYLYFGSFSRRAVIFTSTVTFLSSAAYYFRKEKSILSPLPSLHAGSREKNNFIADVVEKIAPAVVFLEIKARNPITGRPVTLSNGSGFVVRSNGIILTNAHVVANKSSVSVKLQDGRVFEGQVTAVDPISDLATIKIPATNMPTITLGRSSEIRPGEWVLAMGSPLSLSNTVTCGIVSSVQRASKELGLRNKDMDYIQTDAVINFGNSGGPLVNLEGKAIGINTMKVTTGISFAIPSDYATKFLEKAEALMNKGRTENGFMKRRYMGITMLTLTESVMRDLKNNVKMANFADVTGGVFVYKVIPGSPAHIGGILAGDIIIEISGVKIKSAADVYDAVEKHESLKVVLIRGSEKKIIPIETQTSF